MTQTEQLAAWLKDAYAMEQSLVQVLENHAKDAKDHPEMAARIQEHIEESRHHAQRVAECLAQLDEEPSTMKTALGNVVGTVQGASTGMYRDELVKNVLSDYAAEHMEIACYMSLMEAASEAGYPEIADVCAEILQEEENMASWLEQQIPTVTHLLLSRAAVAT